MLKTNFIAQHFLIGKDFGAENSKHSHHYELEIEIEGSQLDQYNYLIDIVEARGILDKLSLHYNDKTLNDLHEFENQNPSIELFSKIIWDKFTSYFQYPVNCHITVRLWEDKIARASYQGAKKSE